MAASGLGLGPWEVFHQGIANRTGLALGTVSILVGIPVLALWWPLGERPGIGTILNVATIGTATNLALPLLPRPDVPVDAELGDVDRRALGVAELPLRHVPGDLFLPRLHKCLQNLAGMMGPPGATCRQYRRGSLT